LLAWLTVALSGNAAAMKTIPSRSAKMFSLADFVHLLELLMSRFTA
jgi:hypothetical protein